ncbi:MAG: hypothetical protein H6577_20165 [Lewinellaceae bacterium]|nr:hypothetical protein [Saprospiraceae bacterium]MCB9340445.1 hypothetical protein [Lewinellaceae bacterium]
MKDQKDISSVFREGAQKLSVQPSAKAWQKLEGRIGGEKKTGRIISMRWLSAVAAVFAVVVGLYFWGSPKQSDFASIANPVPKFLEDLTGAGDCNPYCLLIHSRSELPAYYANPVRGEFQ